MFIGYAVYDRGCGEDGTPLHASTDRGECISMALRRITEISGGEMMAAPDIGIQEHDITQEEADIINATVAEYIEHRVS